MEVAAWFCCGRVAAIVGTIVEFGGHSGHKGCVYFYVFSIVSHGSVINVG